MITSSMASLFVAAPRAREHRMTACDDECDDDAEASLS